jgi:voltage-gated potassium channel
VCESVVHPAFPRRNLSGDLDVLASRTHVATTEVKSAHAPSLTPIGRRTASAPDLRWRLAGPLLALALTLLVGTTGYVLIEGWAWDDALYMVVTTVATVGFGEVHPLSPAGRLFTMLLIFVGVGSLFYAFGAIMSYVFEGHLLHQLEARRMESRLQHITDHFVLCGYGRVGRQVAHELLREGIALVIIDVNPESLDDAFRDGHLVVHGNAANDDVLREAGLDRARGLVAAVAEDADNIFVTLSAHALRPELAIVARANRQDAVRKLHLAGASHVVSPYTMAGRQMAMLAVRPTAVDFVETLLRGAGGDLLIEDIVVGADSPLVDTSVAEVRQRFLETATLLAIRRGSRVLAPLSDDLVIGAGDALAVTGTEVQLRSVEALCIGNAPNGDGIASRESA